MSVRVCRLYGQQDLRLETMPEAQPREGQVLVRIGVGGICGSDLHYFQDGGFGPIRVREPIVLGNEAAGTVEQLGPGVTCLGEGDPVAVESEPAVRPLPLLPRGATPALPEHEVFRGRRCVFHMSRGCSETAS